MGALDDLSDYLSDLFTVARKKRKRKPMQVLIIYNNLVYPSLCALLVFGY
jgi:hypothetical protein